MLAEGVIRICVREEYFHTRIFEPFRLVFLGVLILSEVLATAQGSLAWYVYWAAIPGFAAAYSMAAVFLCTHWFRYHIGPDGIEGYDFWGRSRCSWQSIKRCRRINFFGVEYLLISGRSQRNVWVPLCVDRYDTFRRLLLTYSDPRQQLDELLP